MFRVRTFKSDPNWEQLFAASDLCIEHDWDGKPASSPPLFHLAAGPTRFLFGATVNSPHRSKPNTHLGEFAEGLWEHDVIELFLANRGEERYQEFNIAPNGAWWSQSFASYRKPTESNNSLLEHELLSFSDTNSFRIAISLRQSELIANPADGCLAHVSAILFDPRQYLSSACDRQGKPDFHLRSNFQALQTEINE